MLIWILKFIAFLPLWVLYNTFGKLLFFVLKHILKYRKSVILDNMKHSFPHWSEKELNKGLDSYYQYFSELFIEILKISRISKQEMIKRVSIKDTELATKYLDNEQTIIVLASHICNWEWLLLRYCIEYPKQVDAIYKKLSNAKFDDFIKEQRSKFGAFPIEMNNLGRECVNRKDLTRIIALVADQSPAGVKGAYKGMLLNRETVFFVGPQKLTEKFGYPVLYAGMRRLGKGKYEMYFEEICDGKDPKNTDIIGLYIKALTKNINEFPYFWLWSHKRWKFDMSKI